MGELLAVRAAVIDGELVACDTDGKPDFYSLMRRDGDTLYLGLRPARAEQTICDFDRW
jgi:ATP-dependent DNA ligase